MKSSRAYSALSAFWTVLGEMLKNIQTNCSGWCNRNRQFIVTANALSLATLAVWTIFTLLKASSFPGQPFGYDYGLNVQLSVGVIDGHSYALGFLYPLPSVLLRYYLFKIFGDYSGIIWVCAMAFSLYFIVHFLLFELYTGKKKCRYLYVILAFIPVAYYVQWDLRSLNCNLIVLCLVLASALYLKKGAYFISALFLSLGIALKLYPIIILAYLLIRKQFRLVFSALFWTILFFVIIPVTVLGGPLFLELTGKWIEAVALTGSPDFLVRLVAYKTSLHFAILSLISQGDLSALSARSLHNIQVFMTCLRLFFIFAGLVYLIFDLRSPSLKEVDHNLYSMIMILLASLLFSEQLQPHHGVFLLASSLLVMNFSLFSNFSRSARYCVLAVSLLPSFLLKVASPGMAKAFAMNFHIAVSIIVLIFLRFYVARRGGGLAAPTFSG